MRIRIEAANATVGIEGDRIVPAKGRFDVEIRIPDGTIRPGLINAHDHLHRNHYGRLGAPPYPNAYAWATDIQERHSARIAVGRQVPRREALLTGAWKNLLAGVTTVMHHDRWEADFETDFPLRVVRVPSADSLGHDPESAAFAPGGIWSLHVAEGVDAAAAEEVHALARRDVLNDRLLAVHLVGADMAGVELIRRAGTGIVWCPTSNLFLFGRTAPPALLAPGVDVLLGSDSLLTGAGNLLDELRAARAIGHLDDARLLDAVGRVAARRLGIEEPSLLPGARADLAVFRAPEFKAVPGDVALVVAGGAVRVLDPAAASTASLPPGRRVETDGIVRQIWGDWSAVSG
ncbi:MAG: hypothetical protein JWN66_1035 [Sphingomonas bacterium]|uniref:amidohydrolase family protein n=1 Tax=Sphingomonas bacterium TaxID=1895847 RepID=UPI00262A6390|nr:amidohydrolase family protein [Sphingomonas bacterium]MDB5703919.1 hypothetical protein [Sphingomonas bacterium]